MPGLETVDLDGLLVETQSFVRVGKKLLNLVALVTLELNHVTHAFGVGVVDDGAIASCVELVQAPKWLIGWIGAAHTEVLLDNLQDLLGVKLLGNTLDRGQGLASITLWVDVSLDSERQCAIHASSSDARHWRRDIR
jgi:hypothetical protein